MGFLTFFVKNGEIRPSHNDSYKIIRGQREERNQVNS